MAARRAHQPSGSTSGCSNYQVFLSFRGKDTRKNFTDHLYTGLKQEGFHTFRDDDQIDRGEDIESEIQKAIQGSKISVIVFSKDYASSRWCLDELVMIMEHRKTSGHFVLPVFYDVDPSQVSEQTQSFSEAFVVHEGFFKEEMDRVDGWRAALREVADIAGMVLQDGYESEFIQDIVKVVRNKVNSKPLHVCSYLVGVDYHIEKINSWLQDGSNDVGIGIIYGVGGIGKTTIAKTVYNQNFHQFDGASFLANVRETSKEFGGLVRLQRQLLSNIMKKKANKIYNIDEGIMNIKDAICGKRVLIVLDDVDQPDQFNEITGMWDWFCRGSKIIVTTRRDCLLKINNSCVKFKVEPLNDNRSLQLFCWHAFGQAYPVEGYIKHCNSVVRYCGGIPLALEVLGSSLARHHDLWKIAVQEPQAIDDVGKIQKILKISYDSLHDDRDKNLFLDIACFFIGKKKDHVQKVVESCDFYRAIGIQKLIDQCLVTIDEHNKLMMHQLLRDMGREIVRQESPRYLGKRSRLWNHKDVLIVLNDNAGTDKVEALTLNMHSFPEDESMRTISTRSYVSNLKYEALKNMSNLKFLQLNYAIFKGSYQNFPRRLIWLCWHGFPLNSIPKQFFLEKLVVLDMCHSNLINVWKGRKFLQLLKILDLSHSHSLLRTPDVSEVPSLERLVFIDCPNLVQVHESTGDLQRLLVLNLRDCTSLSELPKEICMLKSLEELILAGCSKLGWLPMEIKKMDSLRLLELDRTALIQIHPIGMTWQSTFWSLLLTRNGPKATNVSLSVLPRSLVTLRLTYCNISDDAIPKDLTSLPFLEVLDLSGNPIHSLPESIKSLTRLDVLVLEDCNMLRSLPELPTSLKYFMGHYNALQEFSNLPLVKYIYDLHKLVTVHDWIKHIYDRKKLVEDHDWIKLELIRNLSGERIGLMKMVSHMVDIARLMRIEISLKYGVFSIIVEASEIPNWFSHQVESFPFYFDVPPPPLGHYVFGLNLCIAYSWNTIRPPFSDILVVEVNNETKGLLYASLAMRVGFFPKGNNGDELWFSNWNCGGPLGGGDKLKVSVFPLYPHGVIEVKRCGIHVQYGKEEIETLSNNEEIIFQGTSLPDNSLSVSDGDFSAYKEQMFPNFLSNYHCVFRLYGSKTATYGYILVPFDDPKMRIQ